jgi:4-amino-4-deoxy-L-arabinose transferase-like glycosyltransferase
MKKKPVKARKQKKQVKVIEPTNYFENNILIYVLFGLALLVVVMARVHLLSIPLERDEGEYAYMAKLILDGHAPYTMAYNMKLPGTYYMFAIFMAIFGKTITGIHLGLLLSTVGSMFLVFYISRNFVSKLGAVIASASFGIIGTSWTILGQAAHATQFVTLWSLIGIALILHIFKSEKYKLLKYFLAGMAFSFAFICKQVGLLFFIFGFIAIVVKDWKDKPTSTLIKNLVGFSLGFGVPVGVMLLYFYYFGDFEKFWFWTVQYLSKYGTQVPLADAFPNFLKNLRAATGYYTSSGYLALWIVAALGIPFIFINKASQRTKIILFAFFLFSVLTIIPGFYFRRNYFITLIPALALMIAVFFDFFNTMFKEKFKSPNLAFISLLAFLILIGTSLKTNSNYLFKQKPNLTSKQIYGSNPFEESEKIARFIKQNTTKDDKIAVLGSEPQILFYADRYSATGHIYTYQLVEDHDYAMPMQKEMIAEIEHAKPKFIVVVYMSLSWLTNLDAGVHIIDWAKEYTEKNYRLVGFMDVMPKDISTLRIGDQLANYKPQSKNKIFIYERLEQPETGTDNL